MSDVGRGENIFGNGHGYDEDVRMYKREVQEFNLIFFPVPTSIGWVYRVKVHMYEYKVDPKGRYPSGTYQPASKVWIYRIGSKPYSFYWRKVYLY
jgi:hypothetical protein